MKSRVHVFISGRVQGVFFRSETQHLADKHNVTGWIRNLSDGRVEAVFEGHDTDIDYLIKFMNRGPQSAAVTQTKVMMEPYKGEFKDFQILW